MAELPSLKRPESPRMRKFLRPVDVITIMYLGAVIFISTTILGRQPGIWRQLLYYTAGVFALLLFLWRTRRTQNRAMLFLRSWYPLLLFGVFYRDTQSFHAFLLGMGPFDPLLAEADQFIFGFQPSLFFSETYGGIAVDEIFCAGYFFYYILFPILALKLYFKRRRNQFALFLFTVAFSFYCYYLIFICVPSGGPTFFPNPAHGIPGDGTTLAGVEGLFFYEILKVILHTSEVGTGAFPSSHVGAGLVAMLFAFRFERKLFWIFLAPALLLMCATVYLREHYFIDVPAGLVTGAVFYSLGVRLKFVLDRRLGFPKNY